MAVAVTLPEAYQLSPAYPNPFKPSTQFRLVTQQAQVDCFRNAAAHLEPGGAFVIETFVPTLRRLPPGERFVPFDVSDGHIGIDEYDIANQIVVSNHVYADADGARRYRSPHRYGWPSEYDLMAQLAGLDLAERWANWQREPFTSESASHISVWRKP